MTSNEKFEQWWASPAAPFNYTVMSKENVRAIWDAAQQARLPDEDAETCRAPTTGGQMTKQELDAIRKRLSTALATKPRVGLGMRQFRPWLDLVHDVPVLLAHADRFAAMTPDVIEVMQEALLHHRAKYGDVHRKLCDKGIVILESLKEKP